MAKLLCSTCGFENEIGSRYCRSCGTGFAPETGAPPETRRVVTVLFCDVVGSTAIAETLDAESFQQMMGRYFAEMTGVIKRHGGATEKSSETPSWRCSASPASMRTTHCGR